MKILILFLPILLWATSPLEKVTLQLQWKHQFEFAGFYAAKHKGFYEEAGLDVSFREYSSQAKPTQSILNNEVQFAVGYASIILEYLQGKPLVFLANFFKQSPLALITQPEITDPRQLIGKKVMGIDDEIDMVSIYMMFGYLGINPDSFIKVPSSYNIEAFVNKEITAMSVFTTNELFLLQQRNIRYTLFNPTVYGAEFYDVNLFTSKEELLEYPGRAKRFRDASIKGWKYALDNQKEIIKLILEKYNTQHKTYEMLAFEAVQIKRIMMPELYPIGSIDEQRVKLMGENFIELGLLPKKTPLVFDDFIYQSLPKITGLTDKEIAYLNQKKQISYCIDNAWMPIEALQDGEHIGISSDYLQMLSKGLTIPFRLVPTNTWVEALTAFEKGECDILSAAMQTPKRNTLMRFTDAYLEAPLVVATTIEKPFVSSFGDLEEKPIGITRGYAFAELLSRQYPTFNLVPTESTQKGLEQVATGELYGIIDNLWTIGNQIQKQYIGTLRISGTVDQTLSLRIATHKEDDLLLSILNKAIQGIDEKDKQQILNNWLSVSYREGMDYLFLLKLVAGAAVLFLFFLFHYRTVKRHNKALQKLSIIDPLTGLFNRRYLDETLSLEYEKSKRYKTPFSLILLDIDDFKKINDDFGHDQGDSALKQIAILLVDNLRRSDVVGRWGGEEFLIICPGTDLASAQKVAEHIRSMLEKSIFGFDRTVTGSFGVVVFDSNRTYEECFKIMDEALYRAKVNGKNRIEAVDPLVMP